MAAPKSIQTKAAQLDRALAQVRKLAAEIEDYANRNGIDGPQFFYDNRLDMAYEYNLEAVLKNLDAVSNGNYEAW